MKERETEPVSTRVVKMLGPLPKGPVAQGDLVDLITQAVTGWNLGLFQKFNVPMLDLPPEVQSHSIPPGKRAAVEDFGARRQELFPDDHRYILDFELQRLPDGKPDLIIRSVLMEVRDGKLYFPEGM